MKNYLFLFILFFTFACSDNNVPVQEPRQPLIKIHAFYTSKATGNYTYPDYNSKVYVYYGFFTVDLVGYDYTGDGVWEGIYPHNKGKTVVPEQTDVIDAEGNAVLTPKYLDKNITIVHESQYYSGRIATYSQSDIIFNQYHDIVWTITHNP